MGSRSWTPNTMMVIESSTNNSNSVTAESAKSQFPARRPRKSPTVQASPSPSPRQSGLKVLGQDKEVTEEELWDLNGRDTPGSRSLSSASGRLPSRSDSAGSRRTPTPSKQISLTAVKRKEDKVDPIDTVDWNDFVRPVSIESERLEMSSAQSSFVSEINLEDSETAEEEEEDHELMIKRREREMKMALQVHSSTDLHSDFSKQLAIDDDQEPDFSLNNNYESERQYPSQKAWMERQTALQRTDKQSRAPFSSQRQELYGKMDFTKEDVSPGTSASDAMLYDKDMSDNGVEPGPSSSDSVLLVGSGQQGVRPPRIPSRSQLSTKSGKTAPSPIAEENESMKSNSAASSTRAVSRKATKDDSTDDEDEEDSEDEEDLLGSIGTVPVQLKMEFLECMMQQDYANAEKLCKMILIYEPNNAEALSFFPLIQEKIRLIEEESGSEEEESDDSGKDDEDDDDSDDEDDDDDDDSDDESSEESDTDVEEEVVEHQDSGVASANSD